MSRRTAVAVLLAVSAPVMLILPALAGKTRTLTDTQRLVMRDGEAVASSPTSDSLQGELAVTATVSPPPTEASPIATPTASVAASPTASPTATPTASVAATPTASPTATPTGGVTPTPSPIAATSTGSKSYAFISSQDLVPTTVATTSVVIVKGGAKSSQVASAKQAVASSNIVNYEQAAALNDAEATQAASLGLLAKDCRGNNIGRLGIASVTIMDLTNPQAVAWRARMIAAETNSGYDQSYLDTLGSYFRDKAYTARPCHNGVPITDQQWRDGSIALVQAVRALTGKPVIANGAGLGSGGGYLRHRADSDLLIAAADGVQIEHFAHTKVDQDVQFMRIIQSLGKSAYAKCDAAVATCTQAFASVAGPNAYLAMR